IARNQGVNVRIFERPHPDLHGGTLQRVEEGTDLPSSKMSGEEEHTLAALLGRFEIFEALVHGNLGNVFPGVAGKEAGFGEQASQRDVDTTQNPTAFFRRFLREGQLEVAHSDPAQSAVQMVYRPAQQDAPSTG